MAGQSIFFFYGLLGISSLGFFVVSLRNAVIEQFQWRLVDRFSQPAHLTRVQTRMSAKDIPFPIARFEEEQRVKMVVKRKMIVRMGFIWIVMWFGGAGIFCAFEPWTYLESLYFCVRQNKFIPIGMTGQRGGGVNTYANRNIICFHSLVCYINNNWVWRLCAQATWINRVLERLRICGSLSFRLHPFTLL